MSAERTIVFLAQGFSEPGGCASHGRKLATGLAARGWNVHVIARLGSGWRIRRSRGPGLRVVEIPGFGHRLVGGLLFLATAIPQALVRRRPHAFLAMQLASPATVASIAARVFARPFVVLSTSTGDRGEVAFVRHSRLRRIRVALLSRASVLIAQTGEGAAELAELMPGSRVEVLPTPVELPAPIPALPGNGNVLYSGRLVDGKNLDVLLEVWSEVMQRLPHARLVIVGTGAPGDPTEQKLRHATVRDEVLARSIEFTGWVDSVDEYLRAADVYVFPSASEGMSNALLEACAYGRVVVASRIPANLAVLGDEYPFLVDVHDRPAFAEALVTALTDQAARAAARRAIVDRLSRFEVGTVVAQLDELLAAA